MCLQVSACQKRLSWSDWAPAAAVEDGTDTKSMLSRVGRGGTRRAGTLLTADLSSMSFSTSAPPPPPSLRHYRQLFPGRFEGIGSARSILEHPPQKNKTTAGEQRGFSSFTIKQTSKKRRIRQPNPDVCSTNSFIRSCFDKLRFRYLYSKSFNALSHTKGECRRCFFKKEALWKQQRYLFHYIIITRANKHCKKSLTFLNFSPLKSLLCSFECFGRWNVSGVELG